MAGSDRRGSDPANLLFVPACYRYYSGMTKRYALMQGVRFEILTEDRTRFLVAHPMLKTKGGGKARVWVSKDHVDSVERDQ